MCSIELLVSIINFYGKQGSNKRLEKAQVPINGAFAIMEKNRHADNTYRS